MISISMFLVTLWGLLVCSIAVAGRRLDLSNSNNKRSASPALSKINLNQLKSDLEELPYHSSWLIKDSGDLPYHSLWFLKDYRDGLADSVSNHIPYSFHHDSKKRSDVIPYFFKSGDKYPFHSHGSKKKRNVNTQPFYWDLNRFPTVRDDSLMNKRSETDDVPYGKRIPHRSMIIKNRRRRDASSKSTTYRSRGKVEDSYRREVKPFPPKCSKVAVRRCPTEKVCVNFICRSLCFIDYKFHCHN